MINIIGNIKIDETKPERINYFFATLLSFKFIPKAYIRLTLNNQSNEFIKNTQEFLWNHFPCSYNIYIPTSLDSSYYYHGLNYHLSELHQSDYYINFEEDHFCVLDNAIQLIQLVGVLKKHNVDVTRTSYHQIETKSSEKVNTIADNSIAKVFLMDDENHKLFQHHYTRFYLGTNAIFKTEYAHKLYNRSGVRPHDFELSTYSKHFEYICAVPKFEILRSIDNDHEDVGSCLLKNPTEKFLRCMAEAEKYV